MSTPIAYSKHEAWPTPIYQSTIEVKDKWLDFCNTTEFERMETDNGDISKDRNILEQTDLKNDIEDHLNNYVRDWLKVDKRTKFYFTTSWLVKHNKGDWSGMHYHANSLVSGVYYLKTPKDSGDIKFHQHFNKSTFPEMLRFEYTEDNMINSEVVAVKVKAGDILLFPSHLNHSVTKNMNNDCRYSLAFNAFIKGDLGKMEYSLSIK